MSDDVSYDYSTDVSEMKTLAAAKPIQIHVQLTEQITTTTRHDDGSTTVHETPPRIVETWVHTPDKGDNA